MKKLLIDKVPENLFKDFKAMCAKEGTTMRAEIVRLITTSIEQHQRGRTS